MCMHTSRPEAERMGSSSGRLIYGGGGKFGNGQTSRFP